MGVYFVDVGHKDDVVLRDKLLGLLKYYWDVFLSSQDENGSADSYYKDLLNFERADLYAGMISQSCPASLYHLGRIDCCKKENFLLCRAEEIQFFYNIPLIGRSNNLKILDYSNQNEVLGFVQQHVWSLSSGSNGTRHY